MRYLFSSILSLNIVFYIFLIFKPLNIESDFSINKGDKLNLSLKVLDVILIFLIIYLFYDNNIKKIAVARWVPHQGS